ncbi:MAG: 50S ribosomal protein L18, partial [Promethearchaeota archaeon]
YLTGYLCGLKSKKDKIKECILDIGILIHKHRVLVAFQGFLDSSGIKVPYSKKIFDKVNIEKRFQGEHIKQYAEYLLNEDKEKYEKIFSSYLRKNLDPKKIPADFKKVKQQFEKEFEMV